MSKTPILRLLDAAKTIQISAVTMVYLISVPLQARMGFAENHPAHGRNSIISSKVKPLNSRLPPYFFLFFHPNLRGYLQYHPAAGAVELAPAFLRGLER